MRLIEAFVDYRDFKIPPWKRGSNRINIPTFWLRVLRNFQRMESEAEQHKMAKARMEQDETYRRYQEQERRKQGKPAVAGPRQTRTVGAKQGVAPSEQAAKDYMKWRAAAIKEQRRLQEDKHQRLLQQQKRRRSRSPRRR